MFKVNNLTGIEGIEGLLNHAAAQLGIDNAEVVLTINDKVIDKFTIRGYVINALLHPTNIKGIYSLMLRKVTLDPLNLILCHEMIHLSQYLSGKLEVNTQTNVFRWKGEAYAADYPYDSRPWEIEAFNKQGRLLRAYKKTLKRGAY